MYIKHGPAALRDVYSYVTQPAAKLPINIKPEPSLEYAINPYEWKENLSEKRTVHEKPVSSQHPDENQHDGQGERQEFSQSETSTAAKWNPALNRVHMWVIHCDLMKLSHFSDGLLYY